MIETLPLNLLIDLQSLGIIPLDTNGIQRRPRGKPIATGWKPSYKGEEPPF